MLKQQFSKKSLYSLLHDMKTKESSKVAKIKIVQKLKKSELIQEIFRKVFHEKNLTDIQSYNFFLLA